MKKTGKLFLFLNLSIFFMQSALAAITASVDHNQIPLDESLSFKISSNKPGNEGFNPKFEAPDFEIMNQFESSQFSSVYVNGKFESKSEKSITFILRPLKVGSLKIRNISNGNESAPDVTVQVIRENTYQKSAGDTAPSLKGDQKNFFVRAEPSKTKAYKGEQVIVSFYIYRRTKANIRDVMQYPSFEGFIREDLEMPILSGRPEFEAVNLGGIPFERALLARYAVYPIKEGKLKIDGFSIRADYIPRNSATDDLMEDPFFQFFSQVTPRTGTSKSDPITIDVSTLPEDGKGGFFTGGVGDFEVSATVDQSNIKTNAPLTLKVSVKGKGNSSLIEFPKTNWPGDFKFYETQGHSKNLGQGVTEKTFEVVLIPLQTGELTIPPITFEFFNPSSRSYIQKKTAAIKIIVAQGEASAIDRSQEEKPAATESPASSFEESKSYGSLKLSEKQKIDAAGTFLGQPWWRWVAWFGLLMFVAFIGLIAYDHLKKKSLIHLEVLKKKEKTQNLWQQLTQEAKEAPLASVFEKVSDQVYTTLDEEFGIKSRTLQLRDLVKILTDHHGWSSDHSQSLSKVLEFSEMVRFASHSLYLNDELRAQAVQMVETAKNLCTAISSKKLES